MRRGLQLVFYVASLFPLFIMSHYRRIRGKFVMLRVSYCHVEVVGEDGETLYTIEYQPVRLPPKFGDDNPLSTKALIFEGDGYDDEEPDEWTVDD